MWVATLIIKLILAAIIPLAADEAYYWVWAQRLQLSYYDHPPLVAWLLKLGAPLESLGHAVRWPGVVLGHCTLLIWILIWKELSLERSRLPWWMTLVLCSPLLGFGSLILTPDLPVLFFWSLAIYFILKCMNEPTLGNYAFLGASLGFGFCSKYHIVLVVPILLAYLTIEKKWSLVSLKGILMTVLTGFGCSLPVLIWNLNNDFISFRFQLDHGLGQPDYEFFWTWSYVLAQVLLLFPTVVWVATRAKLEGRAKLLFYFSWGPLAFFFFSSFGGLVEANWPIVAYPSFLALAALGAERPRPLYAANIFWVIAFLTLSTHIIKPWIPAAPEKLSEFSQFDAVVEKRFQYDPLFASTYQMASAVWYTTKTPFFKLSQMSRFDIFDTYPEGFPSSFPIYVVMKRESELPRWITQDKSFQVEEVEALRDDFIIVRVDK